MAVSLSFSYREKQNSRGRSSTRRHVAYVPPFALYTPPPFPRHSFRHIRADDLSVSVAFMEVMSHHLVLWDSDIQDSTLLHLPLTLGLHTVSKNSAIANPPQVRATRIEVDIICPTTPTYDRRKTDRYASLSYPSDDAAFTLHYPARLVDWPSLEIDMEALSDFKLVPDGLIESTWHQDRSQTDVGGDLRHWALRAFVSLPLSVFKKGQARALQVGIEVCVINELGECEWVNGKQLLTVTLLNTRMELGL